MFFYKEKNKDIRAAAYLRLSIEDGDKAESNSIGNQRELIRDFAAERPGLHLVEEYADDGYTGTNFERPGFKRMMEDIKSGKINCIIVKDLSRLGRNYIEMGCKDMIIAASGDGILIADKERSGYMKPYVEKIETEAMYAEKSWGSYTVIDVQPGSMTVKISMRAGEHMTYHMHNYREEVWTVVSGKGKAVVDGMEQVLRTGDVITIAAGCKHTVEAITALDMIEVQLGDEISVADKIKFPMV